MKLRFIPSPSRIPCGFAAGMNVGFKFFPRGSISRGKMWRFIFVLLIFLTTAYPVLAQRLDFFYVFAKKVEGGVQVGVEIQARQDKTVLTNSDFNFRWFASAGSIFEETTRGSVIKIPALPGVRDVGGVVKAMSYSGNVQFERRFDFVLPPPRVSLIRFNPNLNLILPLTGKVSPDDSIVAFVFDFLKKSQLLSYSWSASGLGIQNQRSVRAADIQNGDTLQLTVEDPENSVDSAIDSRIIAY